MKEDFDKKIDNALKLIEELETGKSIVFTNGIIVVLTSWNDNNYTQRVKEYRVPEEAIYDENWTINQLEK